MSFVTRHKIKISQIALHKTCQNLYLNWSCLNKPTLRRHWNTEQIHRELEQHNLRVVKKTEHEEIRYHVIEPLDTWYMIQLLRDRGETSLPLSLIDVKDKRRALRSAHFRERAKIIEIGQPTPKSGHYYALFMELTDQDKVSMLGFQNPYATKTEIRARFVKDLAMSPIGHKLPMTLKSEFDSEILKNVERSK